MGCTHPELEERADGKYCTRCRKQIYLKKKSGVR